MARDMMRLRREVLNNTPHEETASGAVATFKTDVPKLKECVVSIEPVQEGSGDPSPDNVRPISGWSEANVTRCGKNLTPYSNRGNTTRLWGTSWVNQLALIKTLRPGQYTISAKFTILTNPNNEATVQMGMLLRWKDSDGTWHQIIPYQLQTVAATVGAVYDYSKTFALTDADLAANLEFYLYCGTGTTATTANCYDCQIELGSTATAYEPYQGNTYTIDLNGTRYGGTLDLLTGVLTVDKGFVEYDGSNDETWYSYDPDNYDSLCFNTPTIVNKKIGNSLSICNRFANVVAAWGAGGNGKYGVFSDHTTLARFYFRQPNANVSTIPQWKAWLSENPVTVVYPLATPFTVQLTPTQLRAIKGQNNIFADTGDVSVKYWKHGG